MLDPRRLAAFLAVATLGACANPLPPPDPTGLADADMVRVLAAYQALGAKNVSLLSVAEARRQPTMGDAAARVAQQAGVAAKPPIAKVSDITITGTTGTMPARVYDPQAGHGPAPIIVYFHGGGWVTGDLNTYDASCRELADGTGAIVVSVQYRLAPEATFPAAQDDADAAYNWVLANATSLGGDQRRVALAGESAGGNLAIDTAIWARDKHLQMPVAELLIYPVVGTDVTTPSYTETTNAVPLNRDAIYWYIKYFTNQPGDLRDPRLNVIGAADLHGLPPTTIIADQIDPLRSEDEAIAQKLQQLGVPTQERTYPGVTHEFFGMGAVVAQAKLAEDFANQQLISAFAATVPPPPPPPPGPRPRGSRLRSF